MSCLQLVDLRRPSCVKENQTVTYLQNALPAVQFVHCFKPDTPMDMRVIPRSWPFRGNSGVSIMVV